MLASRSLASHTVHSTRFNIIGGLCLCRPGFRIGQDDVCASFPNFGSFQLVATGLEPDDVVTTCTDVGPYWILAVDSISALQFSMDTVAYPLATGTPLLCLPVGDVCLSV